MPEIDGVLSPANPEQPFVRRLELLGGWCFAGERNCKKYMGLGLNSLLQNKTNCMQVVLGGLLSPSCTSSAFFFVCYVFDLKTSPPKVAASSWLMYHTGLRGSWLYWTKTSSAVMEEGYAKRD